MGHKIELETKQGRNHKTSIEFEISQSQVLSPKISIEEQVFNTLSKANKEAEDKIAEMIAVTWRQELTTNLTSS